MDLPRELIDAIILSPDDPTPLLVAADWLEEQGHLDEATILRLECSPNRQSEERNSAIAAIRQAREADWLAPLVPLFRSGSHACEWFGCFLVKLRLEGAFTDEQFAVLRQFPLLQELTINQSRSAPRLTSTFLTHLMPLRDLRSLMISVTPAVSMADRFALIQSCPHLRSLSFGGSSEFRRPSLREEQFAQIRGRTQREQFAAAWHHLQGAGITTRNGLRRLAHVISSESRNWLAFLPNLRSLTLHSPARQVITDPLWSLPGLHSLTLQDGNQANAPLSQHWAGLRELRQRSSQHAISGLVETLRNCSQLESLEIETDLHDPDACLEPLAALRQLRCLQLVGWKSTTHRILDRLQHPKLLELTVVDCKWLPSVNWFRGMPRLRMLGIPKIRMDAIPMGVRAELERRRILLSTIHGSLPEDAQTIAAWLAEPRAIKPLRDGSVIRIPPWFRRVCPPTARPTDGRDWPNSTLLGSWQEFGNCHEHPCLLHNGPTVIQLERLPLPANRPHSWARWLKSFEPLHRGVRWIAQRPQNSGEFGSQQAAVGWQCATHAGYSHVWIGDTALHRLSLEWHRPRTLPWQQVALAIAQSFVAPARPAAVFGRVN
ncbi:TIGR02996 domain-containing protein [Tuwongella immobilis]|uniref:Repeat-companion domain protein n=1 Tax=Tuwongella immobilis TaxID=692036 RepID=A0A6C2YJ24_9BACT|nr:TIGR02996 domain-containing protein [Tuwongella immobilis]VIP01407.1 unnamed protein product [Tuwongella immobilis]VTR98313.1 unnamed protein product [Tuwongella immobilis]